MIYCCHGVWQVSSNLFQCCFFFFRFVKSIRSSENSLCYKPERMCSGFFLCCRTSALPVRRFGQATTSCLQWRRWLLQNIPITTCASASELCSPTRASTSWTSTVWISFVLTAIGLFRKLGTLIHVQLRCCFRLFFVFFYINDINKKFESNSFYQAKYA